MSTTSKVTLLGKNYPIRFGMKFQRYYMQYLKIVKIADYQKSLMGLGKLDTIANLDALAYFIIAAVSAGVKEPIEFDKDDVLDYITTPEGQTLLADLLNAFQESQPKEVGK